MGFLKISRRPRLCSLARGCISIALCAAIAAEAGPALCSEVGQVGLLDLGWVAEAGESEVLLWLPAASEESTRWRLYASGNSATVADGALGAEPQLKRVRVKGGGSSLSRIALVLLDDEGVVMQVKAESRSPPAAVTGAWASLAISLVIALAGAVLALLGYLARVVIDERRIVARQREESRRSLQALVGLVESLISDGVRPLPLPGMLDKELAPTWAGLADQPQLVRAFGQMWRLTKKWDALGGNRAGYLSKLSEIRAACRPTQGGPGDP